MSSVPEGRAANQPFCVTTLRPPMAAPLPGAWVILARMGSPASCAEVTRSGVSDERTFFWAMFAGACRRS
ncbi:hypothetical protein DSECCO2_470260 [anaerobic digester metagenome]